MDYTPGLVSVHRSYSLAGYPLPRTQSIKQFIAICDTRYNKDPDVVASGERATSYAFVVDDIPVGGQQVLYDIGTGKQYYTCPGGKDLYAHEEWAAFDQPVRILTEYIYTHNGKEIHDVQCIGHRSAFDFAVMYIALPWGKTWFVDVNEDWKMRVIVENLGGDPAKGKAWQTWTESIGRHPLAP